MKIHTLLAAVAVCAGSTGCTTVANLPGRIVRNVTSVAQAINDNFEACSKVKDAQRQLLVDELETERQALLDEALAEQEELESDRQYRSAALRGEALRRQDFNKSAFKESVRTKLGLAVDQDFELGQPAVDTAELERLLASQRKTRALQDQLHEEAMLDWEADQRRRMINNHRPSAALGEASPVPFGSAGDYCCMTSPNDCAQPPRRSSPLQDQSPPPPPPTQPLLLPSQIPLMIPLRLGVQMQQPAIENSEVRRLPLKSPCKKTAPLKEGCTDCTTQPSPAQPKPTPAPAVMPAQYLEDLDSVK